MGRKRVGIIGLGNIGLAIASRLVESGRTPMGFRRGDMAGFVEKGGIAAESIAALAEQCDTIMLVLPDAAANSNVIGQILAAAPERTTIIDVTSQPSASAVASSERVSAAGHGYVEAPISGTPQTVEAGAAQFFVGSDIALFEEVQPILSEIAAQVIRVGDTGSASALKSTALLIMAINIVGVAEGLAYAASFGVDTKAAVEALQNGPAGSGAMRHRGPWMATGDFEAKLGAMQDFKGLLQGIADSASTSTKLFDQVRQYIDEGIDAGIGGQDIAALYALIRREKEYSTAE